MGEGGRSLPFTSYCVMSYVQDCLNFQKKIEKGFIVVTRNLKQIHSSHYLHYYLSWTTFYMYTFFQGITFFLLLISKDIMYFHLGPFTAKSNDTIFFNIQITLFETPFVHKQLTYCLPYCSPKKSEPQYAYRLYAYKKRLVYFRDFTRVQPALLWNGIHLSSITTVYT